MSVGEAQCLRRRVELGISQRSNYGQPKFSISDSWTETCALSIRARGESEWALCHAHAEHSFASGQLPNSIWYSQLNANNER
jgi:hypothetical protein